MKRKRVTIKDVAARAGVSRQTVSRVLNDEGVVADATRTRVSEAINELGYRPSAIARSLVSQRTFSLAVLTADFGDYTHARIIEGAEAEAREHGYLIFVSGADHGPYGEPLCCSPILSQHHAEGLFIVYHGSDQDNYEIFEHIPRDLPIVTVGYAPGHDSIVTVGIANYQGAFQATQHLLKLGHSRIAHITGPMQMYASQERRRGYEAALQEAGATPEDWWVATGDWSSSSGYRATLELLGRDCHFTALFVQNDRMAMGALQALREHQLRVPEDVAVVGFDNIPSTPYFDPPLTTIHQPSYDLGRTGARLLIDLINGEPPPSAPIRLGTKLVMGRSCGATNCPRLDVVPTRMEGGDAYPS
jgi:LacI family repressor for deo operon, udp, cdd, tsx, nupC, and nupG